MKYVLLFLIFSVQGKIANAQDCTSFYLFRNNKTVQLAVYNKKGNPNGTILYHITAQSVKAPAASAALHTSLLDKDGKMLNRSSSIVKCNNGILMMDMGLFLPQQQTEQFNKEQAKIKDVFLEYPATMQAGDKLKDGAFSMEIDNNGVKQVLKMQIDNRTVSGTEKINTSAGSWNCVIITYRVKLSVQTGPINIPFNYAVTEWFAPQFGIIKTTSDAGSTELVAIK